jgi:rsbT co-antagonist protein RsbR
MGDRDAIAELQVEVERLRRRVEAAESRMKAAVEREQFYRSRLDGFASSTPCLFWERWFSPDPERNRVSYCSDYIRTLLGFEPQDWVQPSFWESRLHPDDKERMLDDKTLLAEGGGVREWRAFAKDGRVVWLTNVVQCLRDETGAVAGLRGVTMDVTELKLAQQERERLRRQEEVIVSQKAALAELSSPLIPITDDILVLPIIGSLDPERSQQVLDTVLHGSSKSSARVAIIDITGVRTVDTQAASALTNAARALGLLGVEAVLTGIRPEVAQTLVSLGIRLDGIATRSTLQAGIQYALRRLGKGLTE